jgi:selenocysteine lyase/cysteine desulfurase
LRIGLRQLSGLKVHEPKPDACTVGVVSVSIPGYDPQEAAAVLDSTFGIQVRAGLHCAPRLHAEMGTLKSGGTVRFSLGPFNTEADVDTAIAAISEITRSA